MSRIEIESIAPIEMLPGYHARFVHTAKMTFSYLDVEAGAEVPEHSHPHEQVCMVREGLFQLTLEGNPIRFGPGEVIVIPSHAKHAGLAITNCKLLDVFTPVREDYRALGGLISHDN